MSQTIDLYDVTVGAIRPFSVTIDKGGEYLMTSDSGHFLKFPADADLTTLALAHNQENMGTVPLLVDADGNPIISEAQQQAIDAAVAAVNTPSDQEAAAEPDPIQVTAPAEDQTSG